MILLHQQDLNLFLEVIADMFIYICKRLARAGSYIEENFIILNRPKFGGF